MDRVSADIRRVSDQFEIGLARLASVVSAGPRRCPIPLDDCAICRNFYGSLAA